MQNPSGSLIPSLHDTVTLSEGFLAWPPFAAAAQQHFMLVAVIFILLRKAVA